MSFGIFEAATADDLNDNHRRKLATTRLAQAAAEVDNKLGPMLAKSTSVNDYHDRVRLAEKDFREIVGKYLEGDSGFIAVAKKLEPHYTKRRSRASVRLASGSDVYNHPDVGELHVTFNDNDGTAVVTSPEVGEVGVLRVMPDDGPEDIEEQINILVEEVRLASKKTAGEYLEPGDLDDNRAQFFLEQFADSAGIDTYGGDYDRIWNDVKESVDYDIISDGLRAAIQSEELGSFVGSRMLWDLEAFNGLGSGARFSSKRPASRRKRSAGPPGFAFDRAKDNFDSDLGGVPGRATNLQGESVEFGDFDSFIDGLTYQWSNVDVGRDEAGQVLVDTWDAHTGYSDQFVVEASRRKKANGLVGEYYVDDQTGYAIEVEDHGGSEVGVIYDPNGREIDSIHPGGGYKFEDMHELMGGFDYFLQDSMDHAEKYRRDFHSRRKKANYDVDGATEIIRAYFPELNHNQAENNVIQHMETLGVNQLEEGDIEALAAEIDRASRAGWMDQQHNYASRRKKANPWRSPDDALGSGYFPGWQTDHNEDGWWQINSPDGSDSLVGEGDGSYTMRMDAETPEEAWAERMNFDEALQESEALHYRKNGSRRRAGQARTAQRRGLRRR